MFTNGLAGAGRVKHITDKDYSAVVAMALAMDGFTDDVDKGQVLVGFEVAMPCLAWPTR